PGDRAAGLGRLALAGDAVSRSLHPAAARIDEGRPHLAAQEIAGARDGPAIELRSLRGPVLRNVNERRTSPRGPRVAGGVAELADGELDAGLLQRLSLCFRADEGEHVVPGFLQRERDRRTDVPAAAREEDLHAPSRSEERRVGKECRTRWSM